MTDTKIDVQTSQVVEDNVSDDVLSTVEAYMNHVFYGSDWDVTVTRGRYMEGAWEDTDGDAGCGGDAYQLWDWMQDNQVSSGVDLLLIWGPRWNNESPGCGGASSAYVSIDDGSIGNVADPNTGNNFLIGDGSEEKGEKEISTALMEAGHCWGVGHDDGWSTADPDTNTDYVTPMMGNYASRKAGSRNNCDDQIRYSGYSTERRFEAYTDCAAQNLPSADQVKHYSTDTLADQT